MHRRILLTTAAALAAGVSLLPMSGARAGTHITAVAKSAAVTIDGLQATIESSAANNPAVAIKRVPSISAVPSASTARPTDSTPIAVDSDTPVTLPLFSYFQMAVDARHHHLFFSQGCSCEHSILVTDFSGNAVAAIPGQTGAAGITLSPDGSILYAALNGAHEVTAISTATLRQVAVYPLGGGYTPLSVALQSGKLWVSYEWQAGDKMRTSIGDFALSAAKPVFQTQAAMGSWYSPPLLAADPSGRGNVLVAVQPGLDPAAAASYNTAVNPVTVRASGQLENANGSDEDGCAIAEDVAVVPGGAQFIPACGNPTTAEGVYSTADLSPQGSYPGSAWPTAVAIASGTGTVAGGAADSFGADDDVYLYAPGDHTPLNVFDVEDGLLAPRGLGLTPNDSELFAVGLNAGGRLTLNTYLEPSLPQASLSLAGPPIVSFGHSVPLGGTLEAADGSRLAGRTITITRTGPGGVKTWTVVTDSLGNYAMTSTPPDRGSYAYTARFSGAADVSPAAATLHVTVPLLATSLTLSATPATVSYGGTVRVTAHLGATDTNRKVEILGRAVGARASIVLANAAVNRSGNLTVSGRLGESATFTAVFLGDARYAPRTASASVQTRAEVVTALGGFYASKRVGSVTYRLYHRTKRLTLAAVVVPNKAGECVQVQLEEHAKGVWRDGGTSKCVALGTKSAIGVVLTLARAGVGSPYRLRIDYLCGSDDRNLSADSGWQYFLVEK